MNQKLWEKFDKLRASPFTGHEGLAEFFQKEGIRFAAKDLSAWSQFFAGRFGRSEGTIHVPEWLVEVFCLLAKEVTPKTICDPWAGAGFLVESIREECCPEQALAFTPAQAIYELGRVLVPRAEWKLGDPLLLLEKEDKELDLVSSILPIGARSATPLKVATTSGENVDLRDDLGNLVLVAASLLLSSSGAGLFVVTPSFFFSQRSVFRPIYLIGFGSGSGIGPSIWDIRPIHKHLRLFGRRSPTNRSIGCLLRNYQATRKRIFKFSTTFGEDREGGTLELGRYVDPLSFTSL